MPKKIVIDIETIGEDLESLDEMSQKYLLKFAKTEEEIKEIKENMCFSPLTGKIVAIGMLDIDTNEGAVYFQSPDIPSEPFKKEGIGFIADTEAGILRKFWDTVKNYEQIITFNGRGFDCPFIMLRSAILRISPTKDLMPNRYSTSHIDLLDQLTFFGSVRRKYSLHIWCKAFGIKSPKEEGITGLEVDGLFKEGRYIEIAKYCSEDLYATKELYNYWDKFVKFPPRP